MDTDKKQCSYEWGEPERASSLCAITTEKNLDQSDHLNSVPELNCMEHSLKLALSAKCTLFNLSDCSKATRKTVAF